MLKKRFIAVLIINGQNVVQSVRFKHTNAIHYNAVHAIECFNKWAVDEIVILNVSREKSSKFEFLKTIKKSAKNVMFLFLQEDGLMTQNMQKICSSVEQIR